MCTYEDMVFCDVERTGLRTANVAFWAVNEDGIPTTRTSLEDDGREANFNPTTDAYGCMCCGDGFSNWGVAEGHFDGSGNDDIDIDDDDDGYVEVANRGFAFGY